MIKQNLAIKKSDQYHSNCSYLLQDYTEIPDVA